jgi:hypothetical protein
MLKNKPLKRDCKGNNTFGTSKKKTKKIEKTNPFERKNKQANSIFCDIKLFRNTGA